MRKLLLPLLLALLLGTLLVYAQPSGPTITFNRTENATPRPATVIDSAGGTFTFVNLNATTQNFRWKAYVGNVSGSLVLQDANGYNVYDWTPSTIAGEVYVSRNNSINWSDIRCANNASIANEQTKLNITTERVDSINTTFNQSIHKQIFVGLVNIPQNGCPAIATFINSTRQTQAVTSEFQEILLRDTNSSLVYATPLEQDAYGYSTGGRFDFQLIVPDYGSELITGQVPYYFYVELS